MVLHEARWNAWVNWSTEIQEMKDWVNNRQTPIKTHIANRFGLLGSYNLTVNNNPTAGIVELNSLTIDETSFSGDYFTGIPITLTAIPAEGYVFSKWTGASNSTNAQIQLEPDTTTTIEAVFTAVP